MIYEDPIASVGCVLDLWYSNMIWVYIYLTLDEKNYENHLYSLPIFMIKISRHFEWYEFGWSIKKIVQKLRDIDWYTLFETMLLFCKDCKIKISNMNVHFIADCRYCFTRNENQASL